MADPTDAEIYAALHHGTPGDLAFYRRICAGAKSVLELGCGSGRVLRMLDEPGRRAVGIDLDPGHLELARRALESRIVAGRVEVRLGDMRRLDLRERFDRVLLPHSGLYCLGSVADLDACLHVVRDHLAPGGLLALDAWAADDFHASSRPGDLDDDDTTTLPTVALHGVAYRVLERSTWDRETRTIVARYELVPTSGGPSRHHEVAHRYFTAEELVSRLAAAGLELQSLDGGFEGEPYDADATSMVVVARAGDRDRDQ